MLSLLATLTVAAVSAPAAEAEAPSPRVVVQSTPLRSARNCGLWDAQPVRRQVPTGRFQSLGELPRANWELTVLKLDAEGCSVPVIVRRDVQYDGRFPKPRK